MPEMKVETPTRPLSPSAVRLKIIADARTRPATVKVWAASEDMRRLLRHPGGARFRTDIGQAVEWPNDSFTHRRIADGSVSTEGASSGKRPADDPKLSLRERARAHAARPDARPESKPAAAKS